MFLDEKAGGEPQLPHCEMCKGLILTNAVEITDIPEMAGTYHTRCISSIASVLGVYRTLSRGFGG